MAKLTQHREPSDPTAWGANCDACPLGHKRHLAVPPHRATRPALVVLNETPSREDERTGNTSAGRVLSEVLSKIDTDISAQHLTHALCCAPEKALSPKDWQRALKACRPRLVRELAEVQTTRTILALGSKAQIATIGKAQIFDWMGAPGNPVLKDLAGWQTLSTLSPVFVARVPTYRTVLQIHVARAMRLAQGTLPPWRWPEYVGGSDARVASALRDLAARNGMICVDVETAPRHPHLWELPSDWQAMSEDARSAWLKKYFKARIPQPMFDVLLNVGFADEHAMISIDWPNASEQLKALARDVIEGASTLVYQNGPYDILAMYAAGCDLSRLLANFHHDSLLSHHIVAPGIKHGLAMQGCIETTAPRWKDEFGAKKDASGQLKFVSADPDDRMLYNAQDCYITVLCCQANLRRLAKVHRGADQYARLHALTKIAIRMMTKGIAVDASRFAMHKRGLKSLRSEAAAEFASLVVQTGVKVAGPSKREQLCVLFFDHLGVQPTRFSPKTGRPSLDAKTLSRVLYSPNKLAAKIARALLRYRKNDKLLSTYVLGLPLEYPTGRPDQPFVFPFWKPEGARTGRWSSRGPNMQNVPKGKSQIVDGAKVEILPNMRDLFIAEHPVYGEYE